MPEETRQILRKRLQALPSADFRGGHLELLDSLGYQSDKIMPVPKADPAQFILMAESGSGVPINKDKAKFGDWEKADILFQLTDEELSGQTSLFKATELRPQLLQSYLFFAIELKGAHYSRTDLSNITRQINRLFPMPVMVFYTYKDELSIAVINRRRNKREMHKDVLGKVTLIHSIKLTEPHRGHLDIIFSFSVKKLRMRTTRLIDSFDALHSAWEEIFNVELLNKRFYRELSDWYFWAFDQVEFPDDAEKNRDNRNATSLIRLLTRLIFCWFIKEKGLIPESLFQPENLNGLLKSLKADDSTYYQAILQNLFFATLNQRMGKNSKGQPYRKFATDDSYLKNRSQYGVKNLFRYADAFVNPESALQLFEDIPFLNGGLFECLDREDENGKVQYLDGFSRNKRKQPTVPNELFFGEPRVVDLSAIYADKKRRNQKVRGLIHILNGYKFTIVENTPIEQEIALDPELLGQVFENLLASYNPETQTTARKQTGSFYTPRPIVDYMITESLKFYLKGELCKRLPDILEADADDGLDILFSYSEREHAFTDEEKSVLIQAIDNCKILDPACGSGAFPMGALHKLVFILQKLDPHNEGWMQRQIDKATEIDDVQAREAAIDAIKRAFEDNELDYGRKLYLIENCLYGVDIQPIAIQITKLRCFISLVCDQRANRNKAKNYGIRPLPNLETKFVAANTLIYLPRQQGTQQLGLDSSKTIRRLEKDLEEVRHRHFSATTRREKLLLQKKDKDLREKLALELRQGIFNDDSVSQKIVAWKPYDATSVADFFDPEWMFGRDLQEGFDVVIGNPPFVLVQAENRDEELLNYYKSRYRVASYKVDLYHLFIEAAHKLKTVNGSVCLIVPSNFTTNNYSQSLRKFLVDEANLREILFFADGVFDSTVHNLIFRTEGIRKGDDTTSFYQGKISDGVLSKRFQSKLKKSHIAKNDYFLKGLKESRADMVFEKLDKQCVQLKWLATVNFGMQLRNRKIFTEDVIRVNFRCNLPSHYHRPCYIGKDVKPYLVDYSNHYCYFNREARRGGCWDESIHNYKPKVLLRQIGHFPEAGIDQKGYAVLNAAFMIVSKNSRYSAYAIAGILNSKIIKAYWLTRFHDDRKTFPKIKGGYLKKLPFPPVTSELDAIDNRVRRITKSLLSNEDDLDKNIEEMNKSVQRAYALQNDDMDAILEVIGNFES